MPAHSRPLGPKNQIPWVGPGKHVDDCPEDSEARLELLLPRQLTLGAATLSATVRQVPPIR